MLLEVTPHANLDSSEGASSPASLLRFAVGEFRAERARRGGGGSAEHCELQLLGDDACICNEGEGHLEEEEMRLLVRLVTHTQRVRLSAGEVVAREGDLLLENAFRPKGGRPGTCLLRAPE